MSFTAQGPTDDRDLFNADEPETMRGESLEFYSYTGPSEGELREDMNEVGGL